MNILVLGGTVFLGRHFVEAAIANRHEVTLFNRGKSNPALFPDLEQCRGDRLEGFGQLEGRRFDWVLDTCGFFPRAVKVAVSALPGSRYAFVSSISVFKEVSKIGLTEEAEVATLDDPKIEEVSAEAYGPLKALSEKVALESDNSLVVRPGLIVGPHDPTDRFTYWPARFWEAGDGEVLAPDRKAQPVQFIDVRDLAAFILHLMEDGRAGVYNATGPEEPVTLEGFFDEVTKAVNRSAQIRWIATEKLAMEEVQPWSDLPLVLSYDGSADGMLAIDIQKALGAGLTLRPLAQTAIDTLGWWREQSRVLKSGLSRDRELELLANGARGGK